MKSIIFTGFQWGSSPEVNFLELGMISEVLRGFRGLERNCGARTTKRRLILTIRKDFGRFARFSKVGRRRGHKYLNRSASTSTGRPLPQPHRPVGLYLNHFNHCGTEQFDCVAAYEAARIAYCNALVVTLGKVQDAITNNVLDVEHQTVFINTDTGKDAAFIPLVGT